MEEPEQGAGEPCVAELLEAALLGRELLDDRRVLREDLQAEGPLPLELLKVLLREGVCQGRKDLDAPERHERLPEPRVSREEP